MSGSATARAWAWVAHLRDGGTTRWAHWSGTAEPGGPVLPGVQQLELLRRVNVAGRPSPDLRERLLTADPPRRSRPALPLAGGSEDREHGPRPVEPADVTVPEMLDLVAVVLAQELAALPAPQPSEGTRRPWAARYRLHGDPELGRAVRRHLTARGRPPSADARRLVVVGTDVATMLVDLWTHRALGEGVAPWDLWWRRTTSADRLPGRVDLGQIVAGARERDGVRHVHLVLDPSRATRAAGLRRSFAPPAPMAASAVDLGRRVVAALRPVVPPETRRSLVSEVLRPRLERLPGPPAVAPADHRPWVDDQAERLVARLARDGDRYPVSGSPELLLPGVHPGAEAIRPRDTLASGIGLLLASDGRTTREEAT